MALVSSLLNFKSPAPKAAKVNRNSQAQDSINQPESGEDFVDDLINKLEKSDSAFPPPSEDIQNEIKRLCEDNNVECAIYFQSPADSKHITVLGMGASRIQPELDKLGFDFKFTAEDSGPLHIKQGRGKPN